MKIAHFTAKIATVNKGNKTDREQDKIQTDVLKKGARQMNEFKFEIVRHFGTINTRTDYTGVVWTKEVNSVSWNGKQPKLDIREWANDHTLMSKGITLNADETANLIAVMGSVVGVSK